MRLLVPQGYMPALPDPRPTHDYAFAFAAAEFPILALNASTCTAVGRLLYGPLSDSGLLSVPSGTGSGPTLVSCLRGLTSRHLAGSLSTSLGGGVPETLLGCVDLSGRRPPPLPTFELRFFGAGLLVLAPTRSRHLDSGAWPRGVFGSSTLDLSWPIAFAPGASTCLQSAVVVYPTRSGADARANRSTGDLPAADNADGPTRSDAPRPDAALRARTFASHQPRACRRVGCRHGDPTPSESMGLFRSAPGVQPSLSVPSRRSSPIITAPASTGRSIVVLTSQPALTCLVVKQLFATVQCELSSILTFDATSRRLCSITRQRRNSLV